jgi:hypothetical protein
MKATVSAIIAQAQTTAVQAAATVSAQMFALSIALGEFLKSRLLSDTAHANDTKTMAVGKAITDAASVLESVAVSLSTIKAEQLHPTDLAQVTFTKAASEVAYVADSLNRTFTKGILDGVIATDDVNGASADDDQKISFLKVVSELATVSDVLERTASYLRVFGEGAVTSDVAAKTLTKSFSDVVTAVDAISVNKGGAVDQADTSSATDTALLAFSKALADIVISTDLAAKVFGKSLSESAALSDAAQVAAGKGLTDGASSSDSGNLYGQGYASEDYFAERYVGYERTF